MLNVLYFLYTAMLIWVPEETEHAQRPKRFSPLPTAGLAAMNLAVGLGSAAVTELFAMGMVYSAADRKGTGDHLC